jgi:hypothetical protein
VIDDDDYGAVSGMRIVGGNWSTLRKCASVQFSMPQIPHDLVWEAGLCHYSQRTWSVKDAFREIRVSWILRNMGLTVYFELASSSDHGQENTREYNQTVSMKDLRFSRR